MNVKNPRHVLDGLGRRKKTNNNNLNLYGHLVLQSDNKYLHQTPMALHHWQCNLSLHHHPPWKTTMPTTFLQPKKEQLELEHCTEENFVKTNHLNPDPPHEPQEASGLTIELLHLEKNSRKNRYWGILIYKVLWCFLPRFALFTRLLCSTASVFLDLWPPISWKI